MYQPNNNKRFKLWGLVASIVFHGILVLLLLFVGLKYQVPPPPELGTEIDMGILSHSGNAAPGTPGGSQSKTVEIPPTPQSEDYLSAPSDENLAIKTKPKKNKPKTEPTSQPAEVDEPARINPNALFQRGKVKGGEGKDNKQGQGSTSGTGDGGGGGTGYGSAGHGTSFSLSGRSSKALPKPSVSTSELGVVVVKIFVDQQGNVIQAKAGERGTTISDLTIQKRCEEAAKRAKFTPNTKAPDTQIGTISYKFTR